MENSRSSFIPKQTTAATTSRTRAKKRNNVLGIVSSVLLVAALVAAGGTFFFKDYAGKKLIEAQVALDEESQRFNEGDIAAVRELDRKFRAAKYLLNNHLAPSKLFGVLELSTKETIQFTDFGFVANYGEVELTVGGATEEFASVALQKLQFSDEPLLRETLFTELSTEGQKVDVENINENTDSPDVSFNVVGLVTSSFMVYDNVTVVEAFEEMDDEETSTTTDEAVTDSDTADVPDDNSNNEQ